MPHTRSERWTSWSSTFVSSSFFYFALGPHPQRLPALATLGPLIRYDSPLRERPVPVCFSQCSRGPTSFPTPGAHPQALPPRAARSAAAEGSRSLALGDFAPRAGRRRFSLLLARDPSAIDKERCARDIRRGLGREEHDRPGEL